MTTSQQLIQYSRACGSYRDFFDREFAGVKEATEPRVPTGGYIVQSHH